MDAGVVVSIVGIPLPVARQADRVRGLFEAAVAQQLRMQAELDVLVHELGELTIQAGTDVVFDRRRVDRDRRFVTGLPARRSGEGQREYWHEEVWRAHSSLLLKAYPRTAFVVSLRSSAGPTIPQPKTAWDGNSGVAGSCSPATTPSSSLAEGWSSNLTRRSRSPLWATSARHRTGSRHTLAIVTTRCSSRSLSPLTQSEIL